MSEFGSAKTSSSVSEPSSGAGSRSSAGPSSSGVSSGGSGSASSSGMGSSGSASASGGSHGSSNAGPSSGSGMSSAGSVGSSGGGPAPCVCPPDLASSYEASYTISRKVCADNTPGTFPEQDPPTPCGHTVTVEQTESCIWSGSGTSSDTCDFSPVTISLDTVSCRWVMIVNAGGVGLVAYKYSGDTPSGTYTPDGTWHGGDPGTCDCDCNPGARTKLLTGSVA